MLLGGSGRQLKQIMVIALDAQHPDYQKSTEAFHKNFTRYQLINIFYFKF